MLGKKKKNKDKDTSNVSSNEIVVKIFKSLGGQIRTLKAQYRATEQRDEFGELVSINDSASHKEDVDFQMDSIYRELKILLSLRTKSKEEQKKLLDRKIKKQERLIFYLNKVVELNAKFNYQDEMGKLIDYRILRNYLKIDENGSYFYIENGLRTYEFDAVDGFLIPRWHGNDTYSSNPDHTRIKKIKIQEDLRFQKEIAGYKLDTRLVNYGFIFLVVNMLLLCAVAGGAYYVMNKSDQIDAPLKQLREECNLQTITTYKELGSLYKDGVAHRKEIVSNQETILENQEKAKDNVKDLSPNK